MARVTLRLIGTTDVHAHIHPYDYYRDAPDEKTGLAKAATLIAEARAQAPNAILLDNGDLIQGSPLGDWAAEALGAGGISDPPDDRGDERSSATTQRPSAITNSTTASTCSTPRSRAPNSRFSAATC